MICICYYYYKGWPPKGPPCLSLVFELQSPEALTGNDGVGQLGLGLGDLAVEVWLVVLGGGLQRVLVVHDALSQFGLSDGEGLSGHGEGRLFGLREFDYVAWHSAFVTSFGFLRLGERPRGEIKLTWIPCLSTLFFCFVLLFESPAHTHTREKE